MVDPWGSGAPGDSATLLGKKVILKKFWWGAFSILYKFSYKVP